MRNFGGIENELAAFESADVLLQPIPYDGTSTWGKGADKGFQVFLEAAENMELYDIETDSEVYKKGIHILPEIAEKSSPEAVYKAVLQKTNELLETDKFLSFFGGEHSVSIGIIEAYSQTLSQRTEISETGHDATQGKPRVDRPAYGGPRC